MKLPAKKSLGQHFLNSRHVLEQIISTANIKAGERVLEIGPVTGILTRALLDAGANVLAVEKDDRAFEFLQKEFASEISTKWLNLIHEDILKMRRDKETKDRDNSTWKSASRGPILSPPYAVVANIPYYITGAILESFLEHEPRPSRMTLLVQKEVAERIVARDDKNSVLSISVKAFGEPKIIAKVPRGAFSPPPKVDSAILNIENISDRKFKENNAEITRFFEILKAGFAHKRKYLKSNLEEKIGKNKLDAIWKNLDLNEKIRAEDLSLEKW